MRGVGMSLYESIEFTGIVRHIVFTPIGKGSM